MINIINKRSKGYVSHLYKWIKYKSITVYIKNKTWEGTLHFKYIPKEQTKQTKTNKEEWEKEESYLNLN